MSARARPGLALVALGAIIAVTVSWWALALVPISGPAPEWVLRTRLACFGAGPEGLPNAGGWLLLVGEPIGMLAVLVAVWGDNLGKDLALMAARLPGRVAMGLVAGGLTWGLFWSGSQVRQAVAGSPAIGGAAEAPQRVAEPTPSLLLTDQAGSVFDLTSLRGSAAIVTFAYAHCQTVCPTIVNDVRRARSQSGRDDIPIIVVTLDPWRDVVARLGSIADGWGLTGTDRVLSGSVEAVNSVLDGWGVQRWRDPQNGELDHVPSVVVIDRDGMVAWRLGGDLRPLADLLGGA